MSLGSLVMSLEVAKELNTLVLVSLVFVTVKTNTEWKNK